MPNNIIITPGSASIQFSGSANNDTIRLQVEASGSVAFYGNSGSLFSIVDQLSGSLMSVNDISGLPILEVFSDDRVVMGTFGRNTLIVTGSRVAIDKVTPTADLDVSGSVFITGSLNMNSGGITGSLFGTASSYENSAWSTYTPQWTSNGGTDPVIGNGTISGYYKLIGKVCFVRVTISMGSTTTFGTGEWLVSLPFSAADMDAIQLPGNLLDNGTAWYNCQVNGARAGFTNKAPIQFVNTSSGYSDSISATQPFTWTNTDRFMFNGSYEIA